MFDFSNHQEREYHQGIHNSHIRYTPVPCGTTPGTHTLAVVDPICTAAHCGELGIWHLQEPRFDNQQIATVHAHHNNLAVQWSRAIRLNLVRVQALLKTPPN